MRSKKLMMRIMRTPYKAICRAKDLYVRSITNCGNSSTTYGGLGSQFPRSSSSCSSSNEEDLRELIRANSTARMKRDLNINQNTIMPLASASRRVPRSVSVGMGRIDEDAPVSSFPDVQHLGRKVKSDHLVFPRSKSHATANINTFF